MQHGWYKDISPYLLHEFGENCHAKKEESSPSPQEVPVKWFGVDDHAGDLLTFKCWNLETNKEVSRSTICSAKKTQGAIVNNRVDFGEEESADEEALFDDVPSDVNDMPGNADTPNTAVNQTEQQQAATMAPKHPTKKHKVKWHDTVAATEEQVQDIIGFKDAEEGTKDDFSPCPLVDDLKQSNPARRQKLARQCTRAHLVTASALLAMVQSHTMPIIDSGVNAFGLSTMDVPFAEAFDPTNAHHILESEVKDDMSTLN